MQRGANRAWRRLAVTIGQWDGAPFAEFDNGSQTNNPESAIPNPQSRMPLFVNVRRKNTNPSGKFHRTARTGLARGESADYRGWTYDLVRHTTGTTLKRTVYHVTIADPTGFRAAYLTNFQAAGKAVAAARERINQEIDTASAKLTSGSKRPGRSER